MDARYSTWTVYLEYWVPQSKKWRKEATYNYAAAGKRIILDFDFESPRQQQHWRIRQLGGQETWTVQVLEFYSDPLCDPSRRISGLYVGTKHEERDAPLHAAESQPDHYGFEDGYFGSRPDQNKALMARIFGTGTDSDSDSAVTPGLPDNTTSASSPYYYFATTTITSTNDPQGLLGVVSPSQYRVVTANCTPLRLF